jgi:hypothetical protein
MASSRTLPDLKGLDSSLAGIGTNKPPGTGLVINVGLASSHHNSHSIGSIDVNRRPARCQKLVPGSVS